MPNLMILVCVDLEIYVEMHKDYIYIVAIRSLISLATLKSFFLILKIVCHSSLDIFKR